MEHSLAIYLGCGGILKIEPATGCQVACVSVGNDELYLSYGQTKEVIKTLQNILEGSRQSQRLNKLKEERDYLISVIKNIEGEE